MATISKHSDTSTPVSQILLTFTAKIISDVSNSNFFEKTSGRKLRRELYLKNLELFEN